MCGICGTIGFGELELLKRMTQTLRHRGPDDEGYYTDGAAGLGMVRLSVIDLVSGRQPITDERGRYQLVFNGEIYNYLALREQLEAKGHRFATRSDTEVIVHLYEEHQERCVEYLNGDFAFAVWDTLEQRLFLARDRLGVKPLYYWHRGTQLAFASELKALLCLPPVSRQLDYEALDRYLTFLYIPAPSTIFHDVRKLPPACWLSFSKGVVRVERYWRLPGPRAGGSPTPNLVEAVRERLERAVRVRLMSEVPLGAFLSGGIDSSCVVALMSQCLDKPVQTFSIGFEKPYESYNELPAARMAANAFHTDHHEFVVKPDITSLLPQVVWHMDEPFADSSALLTFLISREAKRKVTVALTGIGGDEVFGGYPRYLGAWASLYYERLPRLMRMGFANAANALPASANSRDVAGWVKRFLREGHEPRALRYLHWRSYVTAGLKQELYAPDLRTSLDHADSYGASQATLEGSTGDYLDRVNALDLQTYLPDDLLVMGDKMSMAHGLEVRVPFCDHELVELAASIPMRQRLEGFRLKGLLKRAVRDLLPASLLRKPKQGFMLPLGRWLQHDLQPWCRQLLAPEQIRRRGFFRPEPITQLLDAQARGSTQGTHQVYALVVLELWCQRYLDGV